MSLTKQSKPNAGQLPKSVKVRSTCNACQQAKIRCSHEKPSCRRCQKHKIDCIYSVSRRLGRPAKKKGPRPNDQENGSDGEPSEDHQRKMRKPMRKKSCTVDSTLVSQSRLTPCQDKAIKDRKETSKVMENSSVEDESPSDLGPASKHWLQELSAQVDWGYNIALEHLYDNDTMVNSLDLASNYRNTSMYPGSFGELDLHFSAMPKWLDEDINHTDSGQCFAPLPSSLDIEELGLAYSRDSSTLTWLSYPQGVPSLQKWQDQGLNDTRTTADVLIESMDQCSQLQLPDQMRAAEFNSLIDSPIESDDASNQTCDCYTHALSELLRSSVKRNTNGFSTIDGILICQKELLLQADSILRCRECSQSEAQATMLMVIVVTIDSLLTSLDATVTSTSVPGEMSSSQCSHGSKKRTIEGGDIKSEIDACPLLVGEFQVPGDEKAWFIRHVFQVRLSSLLKMIRRIRVYMQQNLAAALSRGRLMLIMETDRRLQLILMKIKMAVS